MHHDRRGRRQSYHRRRIPGCGVGGGYSGNGVAGDTAQLGDAQGGFSYTNGGAGGTATPVVMSVRPEAANGGFGCGGAALYDLAGGGGGGYVGATA